jgi:FtsP/CotA-like multicopper oxidase with cupredoxin domain
VAATRWIGLLVAVVGMFIAAVLLVAGTQRATAESDVPEEHAHDSVTDSIHDHGDTDGVLASADPYAEGTRPSTDGFDIDAHEGSEGSNLGPNFAQHTAVEFGTAACPATAPKKIYDVVAIRLDMVVNRWGDHDPEAYMFALRDQIPAIRAQEAMGPDDGYGLSLGIGADAIQPLTIRANPGDCIQIAFENDLTEPASFNVHGADLIVSATGEPALTTNPDSSAMPGESVALEWYVEPGTYEENTHYIHSHGARDRYQSGHGLFGALIVEPAGSQYFDQRTGENLCRELDGIARCRSTWDAMISPGEGSDFREYAMFYHGIGNERFALLDANDDPNPSIDPIVHSYKPNGRAINYRSESFYRRMGEAEEQVPYYLDWSADEAEAYGSYSFGDPATPVPQSYVGDPAKFRILHGGSETFHVPHLHGGGIQWQRQPDVGEGDPNFVTIDEGLRKAFASSMPSSGNDSQTIGPSETYEFEISCGSGGCQDTAGDFLFHCHVASHYISGMWHFWRVYNTLQDDVGKLDNLAALAELPDRAGDLNRAVTSAELLGNTVDFAGAVIDVDEDTIVDVVETQLPPRGVPNDEQDAAVMDWVKDGSLYLNQPETAYTWPNFAADQPGERLPLMFSPSTGKLAFPFLRPHLGSRPPFAPDHGPAPYLDPHVSDAGEPAEPGASGDHSLCPAGAPRRFFNVHAINTDIPVTSDITDNGGMIFVLKENEERARTEPDYKFPLAIRANQGDCVDVLLINELPDDDSELQPSLMKTNIHIHFVQFDVQASDGVISGANYEQAVRPITSPGASSPIVEAVDPGADRLTVDDASSFHPGSTVVVGVDQLDAVLETAKIETINGNEIVFSSPLRNAHSSDELVSIEFVQYRWFVARQNGAIYFHDHVDALNRWGHGLFGALIAEPTGATYRDSTTGEEIRSGPVADIHNTGEVVPGLDGSFREYVLFMNDRNPITGSSFNLRAEPLHADTERGDGPPDLALSSVTHGDPHTQVLEAYSGDPIMLRLLTTATEEVHPFHITGHTFRQERFQEDSPGLTTFGVGISERFNAYIPSAGGGAAMPGDYLYYNGTERHFIEGAWGILRVRGELSDSLQPLPGREVPAADGSSPDEVTGEEPTLATDPGEPCPTDARDVAFDVAAIETELDFNMLAGIRIEAGRMYVLEQDRASVESGETPPEPLVIRVNSGDCVSVTFTNHTDEPASFHVDAPQVDPRSSLGITIGYNNRQSARPGEAFTYRFYAQDELGTVIIRDFGNRFSGAREGLYGALVVEPEGSTYHDPYTGEEIASGLTAVIRTPDDGEYREFVTVFEDTDPDIGLFIMPYDQDVNKLVGVNYRAEPLTLRLSAMGVIEDGDELEPRFWDKAAALYDSDEFWDPVTGVFEAFAGDRVVFRVASAYSEQNGVFSVEAHQWQLTPTIVGSDVVSSRYLPPSGVLNVAFDSAGGSSARPGDYVWGNHRMPYTHAGQWGVMRVFERGADEALLPLGK